MWPIVLAFLSVLCIGNGVVIYLLWRKKQHLAVQVDKAAEQQQALQRHLNRRLESYLSTSMRMGEELHELQRHVAPLPEKILRMEQKDPKSLSFIEATRLVGLGATTEDIKKSCGLTHAEAELMLRMHGKKSS